MYTRSELRHACFRAKNNAVTAANQLLLDVVEPLLQPGQRWDNFVKVWDLLVNPSGKIIIIRPETDYDYVHSTCLMASIYAAKNMKFDFSDRELNIITIVEAMMLEGLMTWPMYNKIWGIEFDSELRVIKTKLYNVSANQFEVTDQMIEDSKKDLAEPTLISIGGDSSNTVEINNTFDVVPVTKEQAEEIIKSNTKSKSTKK